MTESDEKHFSSVWQRVKAKLSQKQPNDLEAERRAAAAKGLLANATFNEAYACARDDLMEAWAATDDPATREALHAELKAMQRIVKKLGQFHRYADIQAAKAAMADQRQ